MRSKLWFILDIIADLIFISLGMVDLVNGEVFFGILASLVGWLGLAVDLPAYIAKRKEEKNVQSV